jgi:hypothetical protein
MNDQDINRRIADEICERFSWRGQTFRQGEFVALLDGKIVAVSQNADDAINALRNIDPDPMRGVVIEVAHPVVDVIRGVQ